MPVQAPQWTEFLSCAICYNEFDCNLRRPVSLKCAHTICKSCLLKLQGKQCPFDQTVISNNMKLLPDNYALLQLVGGKIPDVPSAVPSVPPEELENYLEARKCIEEIALYLKMAMSNISNLNCPLSRPMQRKLVTLINCQLAEEEGRTRAMRATRSLGERSVTELILQHQNSQQLSANLWAAVRARGCQFLGPIMQEEFLKAVLLALQDGSALSRKVLVMFIVQRLGPNYPQASKTSIGHVVQLLYRASCFKVSKRDGDSSLMQLKEEFRVYEALRREHDAQIVQIATEAGLRIAPEQWSSLLYGDTTHKSHMQSIIDKLQTPQSFSQSIQELVIALQRTSDPGNLSLLIPHLEILASIDPSYDMACSSWKELKEAQVAAKIVVKGLIEFVQIFKGRKQQDDKQYLMTKYKTSMCRDIAHCPRGHNCTYAHSQDEMDRYRAKNKYTLMNRGEGITTSCNKELDSTNSSSQPCSSLNDDAAFTSADSESFSSSLDVTTPCTSQYVSSGTFMSSNSYSEQPCSYPKTASYHLPLKSSHILNPNSPVFHPSTIPLQSLSKLHERKNELIAQLVKLKNLRLYNPMSLEETQTPLEVSDNHCYSPWTTTSLFSGLESITGTKSSSSPSWFGDDSQNDGIEKFRDIYSGLFCPSEKDEFIPFGPPLVSKYGPILRCAKSNVGPAESPLMNNLTCLKNEPTFQIYSSATVKQNEELTLAEPPFEMRASLPFCDTGTSFETPTEALDPRNDILKNSSDLLSLEDESASKENQCSFNYYKGGYNSFEDMEKELWEIERTILEKEHNIHNEDSNPLYNSDISTAVIAKSIGKLPALKLHDDLVNSAEEKVTN